MSVIRIASRYAKSLIDLAVEQDKLEKIHDDILAFDKAVEGSREFALMLKSPIIAPGKKESIINQIFEGKLDETTMSFFKIVINKARAAYLIDIANEFIIQYDARKSIKHAKFTTATKVDEKIKADLEKMLKESTGAETLDMQMDVDAELIGGFVLQYDDMLIDASVAHKLEVLKKEFSKNTYIKKY